MKIAWFPVFALLRLFLRYFTNENLVNEKRIKVVKKYARARAKTNSAFVMSKNTVLNLHKKLGLT